jgi:CelD/BcsL family acetyltransferase involved in cellulose biosynthesis
MLRPIDVKFIRSMADLEPHADAWDKLVNCQPEQLPFNSHAWIATFLQNRLLPREQWCCMLAYEGSELVGVLPLIIAPYKIPGFGRRQLQNPKGAHTRSVGLVAAPGKEAEVIESFLSSLNRVDPRWYSVYFERIPASSPIIRYLDKNTRGLLAFHKFVNMGSYLPTTGNFDDFRSSLRKSFRTNLTTASNRLSHYKDVHYEFFDGERARPAGLERFMKVEEANWKGQVGSAIIQSADLIDFYSQLAKRLAGRWWLEWHFLEAEGKTIAGNLAIRCCRTLFIWKLGYDEDYAKCSPGTMLFEQVVKRAFESSEIDKIDLISDPSWAKNWQMQRREFHDLWIYPRRIMPFVFNILPKRFKSKLRKIPILQYIAHHLLSLFRHH